MHTDINKWFNEVLKPGEGNGNPLQYSCLENSMDRGVWQAPVHGVTKSQTQLSHKCVRTCACARARTHTHIHTHSKTRFFRNLYVSSGLAGELSGSSFLPEVHRRIPPSDRSLCLRSGPESIYLIKTAQAPVLSHQTLDPSPMKTSHWILKIFPRVSLPHTALGPLSPPISLYLPVSFTHTHTHTSPY